MSDSNYITPLGVWLTNGQSMNHRRPPTRVPHQQDVNAPALTACRLEMNRCTTAKNAPRTTTLVTEPHETSVTQSLISYTSVSSGHEELNAPLPRPRTDPHHTRPTVTMNRPHHSSSTPNQPNEQPGTIPMYWFSPTWSSMSLGNNRSHRSCIYIGDLAELDPSSS